ncbi:MAG TPA: class I lanthipeptide [Chitinophaga sp.]|uniref:class I lanthipeptide n=1 Tax=Chitinophaga sp. TaxID=1869181 RepID=UPI002BA97957|nr:class I lanthipeptide [Chitinophaga sp.]HVI43525.1 class I lanthipeptide [Chitinophaga sp.]
MKKKTSQKLHLNKIRIAALQPAQSKNVNGGIPTTGAQSVTCPWNEACVSGIIACESVRICQA